MATVFEASYTELKQAEDEIARLRAALMEIKTRCEATGLAGRIAREALGGHQQLASEKQK